MNKSLRKHNCLIGIDYDRKLIMCSPKEGNELVLTIPSLYAWHAYNLTTENGIREWIVLEIAGWANREFILRLKNGYRIAFHNCNIAYLYGMIVTESEGGNPFCFEKGKSIILRGSPFYANRKMIFLSHSSHDKDYVRVLARDLERAADVFFDEKSIVAGSSIVKSVNEGLSACDVLVLVISRNSVSSDWVLKEYAYAMHTKKTIIPVLIDQCEIPPVLMDIKYIEAFKDGVDVFDTIIKAVDAIVSPKK